MKREDLRIAAGGFNCHRSHDQDSRRVMTLLPAGRTTPNGAWVVLGVKRRDDPAGQEEFLPRCGGAANWHGRCLVEGEITQVCRSMPIGL